MGPSLVFESHKSRYLWKINFPISIGTYFGVIFLIRIDSISTYKKVSVSTLFDWSRINFARVDVGCLRNSFSNSIKTSNVLFHRWAKKRSESKQKWNTTKQLYEFLNKVNLQGESTIEREAKGEVKSGIVHFLFQHVSFCLLFAVSKARYLILHRIIRYSFFVFSKIFV